MQIAGITSQQWSDNVMQNENFIETRPQTSNYTIIYVRERQEGAKRLVYKNATTCREAETL